IREVPPPAVSDPIVVTRPATLSRAWCHIASPSRCHSEPSEESRPAAPPRCLDAAGGGRDGRDSSVRAPGRGPGTLALPRNDTGRGARNDRSRGPYGWAATFASAS